MRKSIAAIETNNNQAYLIIEINYTFAVQIMWLVNCNL